MHPLQSQQEAQEVYRRLRHDVDHVSARNEHLASQSQLTNQNDATSGFHTPKA